MVTLKGITYYFTSDLLFIQRGCTANLVKIGWVVLEIWHISVSWPVRPHKPNIHTLPGPSWRRRIPWRCQGVGQASDMAGTPRSQGTSRAVSATTHTSWTTCRPPGWRRVRLQEATHRIKNYVHVKDSPLFFSPSHLSASTLGRVPAWIMTCQWFRSSAISVVIWFLAISSFTRSLHLTRGVPRFRFPLLSSVISFSWRHLYLASAHVHTISTSPLWGILPSGTCGPLSRCLHFSHDLVLSFLLPTATCHCMSYNFKYTHE